jgi:predicted dehydrogenase
MKILIVGSGSIGKRHANNAAKLAETAVFDIDPQIAEICARDLGIRTFSNLQTALEWNPDGVVIATPTNLHIPTAHASVEAGADVLIEKPLSHSSEGVDAFLDLAETLHCKVFVVCNLRFHPAMYALRQNLELIGRPLCVRAHYGNYLPDMRPNKDYRKLYSAKRNQGGGVVLDGIHELDYLICLFGPVIKTLCYTARVSDLEIETEDYASISMRHKSGVVSEIHLDYLRPFKRRGCEIVGDQGMLLWQSEGKNPEKCSVRLYRKKTVKWEALLDLENVDLNKPYETLMEYFVQGIRGEEVPVLKGREAAEELSVALKALEMSRMDSKR